MSLEDSTAFCAKLYAGLGRPRDSAADDKAHMQAVAERLQDFTADELQLAYGRIIDTYKGKSRWPKTAELKDYCNAARTSLTQPSKEAADHFKARLEREKQDAYFYSKLGKLTAAELIKSPMGQKAAAEGWILGLYDYCRKHGKLPDPYSPKIKRMREAAQFLDDCMAGKIAMGVQAVALRKLGANMLEKRRKLTEYVNANT